MLFFGSLINASSRDFSDPMCMYFIEPMMIIIRFKASSLLIGKICLMFLTYPSPLIILSMSRQVLLTKFETPLGIESSLIMDMPLGLITNLND